ncbi:MAG: LytTR family DNA-binding domain-containing protein [Lachnospiraceae bacterium]|nr:LytTR family DNA-binding domain-containing protein [Lachnospiraceae bacterium]
MRPIKIVLCDANAQYRMFFYKMCKEIKEQKHIQLKMKAYEHGNALLFDFEDSKIMSTVDIVFLEIDLPKNNGVEVSKRLREYGYQNSIIFIAKSDEHWPDAFDVKACNYITKDAHMEKRLLNIFAKAVQEAIEKQSKSLLFSSLSEIRKINIEAITHFEIADHLVCVYYEDEIFKFVSSLTKVENLLFHNDDFIRVNRACILSISHIKKYDVKTRKAFMSNGAIISVSTRRAKELMMAFTKWEEIQTTKSRCS